MTAYVWRGDFRNAELNALHAEAFEHRFIDDDWEAQVARHSLGWVCARDGGELVGFVNVPWDGGVHAFVLDTVVAANAGCEWLHVDFEEHLRAFYFDACGFTPTDAGLMRLR